MDHHSAIDSQAAERYTLAEMTQAERADFEMHYFDCTVCTGDVLAYEKLRIGVRDWNPKPVPVPKPDFLRQIAPWALAASIAGWGCVGVDRLLTQPRLRLELERMSGVITEHLVVSDEARAAADPPQTIHAGRPAEILVDITHDPQSQFTSYSSSVTRSPAGTVRQRYFIPVEETSNSVVVLIRPLPAGSYEVVIEGVRKDGNRSEITRQPFVVVEGS